MMQRVTASMLFALLLSPLTSAAQEGKVIYDETVKIEINLPPEMADMKDKIPNSQTAQKMLVFNETESMTRAADEEAEPVNIAHESEGIAFKMSVIGEENETYVNFDDEQSIEKRDFMGRTFLITGDLEPIAWKLTSERSEFLGYMCMKATAVRDSTTLEAWFTPEIPIPAGPELYGGLPGLILVLNIDDGKRSFAAKEVQLEELPDDAIQKPAKGKKVSREEFDKIVEDKMKEMGVQRSGRGGGQFQVTIRN